MCFIEFYAIFFFKATPYSKQTPKPNMRNKNAMQQTGVDVSYDLWEAACEGGWVVKDATDKNKGK